MVNLSLLISIPPTGHWANTPPARALISAAFTEVRNHPFFGTLPVAWNITSSPLTTDSAADADELTAELALREDDIVVPMGFSGAPLHLLTHDEATAEIGWSMSNMWHSGWADLGITPAPFVLPPSGSRLSFPVETSLPIASVGRTADGAMLSVSIGASYRGLPALDRSGMSDETDPRVRRDIAHMLRRAAAARRRRGGATRAVILTSVSPAAGRTALVDLLDEIAAYCERGHAQVSALPGIEAWDSLPHSPEPLLHARAPELKTADAAALLRKGRTTRATRRTLLGVAATGVAGSADEETPGRPRDFVASMMGDVTLPGADAEALFSGGQFCGFRSDALTSRPASGSYVRHGQTLRIPRELNPTTCFSFESDRVRGLRVAQQDPAVGVQLVSDFAFVGEYPFLVTTHVIAVEADARWPEGELIHLALPMEDGADVTIITHGPGREDTQTTLSPTAPETEQFGSQFELHLNERVIGVAFLTRSGLPIITSVGTYRLPDRKLGIGGRFALCARSGETYTARFAMLIAEGLDAVQEMEHATAGRLPAPLLRELRDGPVSQRMSPISL